MRQINRIDSNLTAYMQGLHTDMAVDIMAGQRHPELREEGKGLGLQRGGTQFKEDENEQLFSRQCLLCHVVGLVRENLNLKSSEVSHNRSCAGSMFLPIELVSSNYS